MTEFKVFAAAPVYLEDLLEKEIIKYGGTILTRGAGGHLFSAGLKEIYEMILWSRISSRIMVLINEFSWAGVDDIYRESVSVQWDTLMEESATFACYATSAGSVSLPDRSASLKVKDGIADFWREKIGKRPDVDRHSPDISVHLHLKKDTASLYLDLSGGGLHRRGYRQEAAKAGLRENTADAILMRAGWPDIASSGGCLVDPMCGSGTLLIEAAFMAADLPPGLLRYEYGFFKWREHDPDIWESVFDSAESSLAEKISGLPPLMGFDSDRKALAAARENILAAGLDGYIHLEKRDISEFTITDKMKKSPGLIVTNPPYGQRLGDKGMLYSLYRKLGDIGRNSELKGWKMSVISDDETLLHATGLKTSTKNRIMNGPIKCSLYHYVLYGTSEEKNRDVSAKEKVRNVSMPALTQEAEQFLNRLKKNRKALGKWSRKGGVSCYRLYDADLPNFNFAVDFYEGKWVHLQEYSAPKGIDLERAEQRLKTAVQVIASLLEIPVTSIFTKQRSRQKGRDQYRTLQRAGERYLINEWDCRFWVNFTDYLDTGIFLDHRNIRKYLKEHAIKSRVLNLFCYTGTASVMAAAGGASSVTSVDTSSTYLKWAEDNFMLNKIPVEKHRFIREDVKKWLNSSREIFDLIFMDPPTFSNSKSRRDILQIQEDHDSLIRKAMNCLKPGGLLIFSNNYKRFVLDETLQDHYRITEETTWSESEDFKRKGASHRCWFFRHNSDGESMF